MNRLGEVLCGDLHPPLKVLFVYNANPLTTVPCQEKVRAGLEREDLFTIVFEQVLTDTARYADLLLPATTFLERREMSRGYGAMVLQDAEAVIPPVGEARSNHEVFADLCRHAGVSRPGEPESAQEIRDAILAAHPQGDAYRETLDAGRIATPPTGYAPIPFVEFAPWTADGKIHLFPDELDRASTRGLYDYAPDPATPSHPLALISPATGKTVSSTFGQLWTAEVFLEMHPEDARVRGIDDGDRVRVANSLGEVRIRVRITDTLRPGVVLLPKGIWSRHTLNGSTSNALVPDSFTDLGGGACFNDARVEVERLA
jgi:anaerobic selenocysteine-containing dehydrogenase